MIQNKYLLSDTPYKWKDLELLPGCEGLDTSQWTHEYWEGVRRSLFGIGGSDVGIIMGVSEYKSSVRLFYEKLGLVNPSKDRSEYMDFMGELGRDMEPVINKRWEYSDGTDEKAIALNMKTGNKLNESMKYDYIVKNSQIPWLFANVDRMALNHFELKDNGILEFKNPSLQYLDRYILGMVPTHVLQVYTYLLVTQLNWGQIAIITDNRRYREHTMYGSATIGDFLTACNAVPKVFEGYPEDYSLARRILECTRDFYQRMLDAREVLLRDDLTKTEKDNYISRLAPPADGTADYAKFFTEKHMEREALAEIDGTAEVQEWAKWYKELGEAMKVLKEAQNNASAMIRQHYYEKGIRKMNYPEGSQIKTVSFHRRLDIRLDAKHFKNEIQEDVKEIIQKSAPGD